jgi:hypothetical protein
MESESCTSSQRMASVQASGSSLIKRISSPFIATSLGYTFSGISGDFIHGVAR